MPLTERQAKATRWEGKDQLVSAGDCLFLMIRKRSRTWLIRRRINGKTHVRTLGHYPEMPVQKARALALADAMARDPDRRTVRELAEDWYANVVSLEHKRPDLMRGYLDRAVIPDLGHKRVSELNPTAIAQSIAKYKHRGARAADSLRSVYNSMMVYAIEIGVRQDNPAASLTRRVAGYRPKACDRVLSDIEIRLVWNDPHANARLLRFLLLTGLRISEAQKGHQEGKRWIVPAAISKNARAHWVQLTASALEQLPLPESSPTGVQAWVRRWCARNAIDPAFTPHDCRRTAATRMADAGVEPFIVERMLNHTLDGVMAVYNHAEYASERIAAAKTLEQLMVDVGTRPLPRG
ncbi:MAG: tyrosine-type recombinase/integrase [Chromatiaceae bacterium]|nr:tyrosine-type recombinase/integrase [Chromatiaceae bacterium]